MKWEEIQTNNPLALKDDGIYYQRKINDELLKWKNKANHLPLVVKGLRQSGKSRSILQFGMENYSTLIYIDFRNHADYARFFADYDVDKIKERLSVAFGFTDFIPKKTLLFFDEIQDCPIARGSLKNFALDGRYDVICSGSMLGVSGYDEDYKQYVPVGYEEIWPFSPMDFEEFLWAYGLSSSYTASFRDLIANCRQIDDSVHESLLSLFRLYLVVGGMPSVVVTYFQSHDLSLVRRKQQSLVASYKDDFGAHLDSGGASYSKAVEKAKINAVFDSMPRQLSRENTTKFSYNLLADSHAKGDKYKGAIQWLIDYGLLLKCPYLDKIDYVQSGYDHSRNFKLYFADSGLFCSTLDPSIASSIIFDSLEELKGPIYENMVADAFAKSGRKLYTYAFSSRTEIDFISTYEGKIALVEVKAKSGKTPSADVFLASRDEKERYLILKLSAQNIGKSGQKLTIPYYLASFLPKEDASLSKIEISLPDPKELEANPVHKKR